MELKDRITLLDDLLVLNEQAGLPEDQVVNLVEFLAAMPGTEREIILEYIQQGDRYNRFERFAKLASMETGQRDKILKAMGLQNAGPKGLLQDFFGSAGENTNQVKQTINNLAEMRKTVWEGFLEPLAQLFRLGKQVVKK